MSEVSLVTTENLLFTMYSKICELEAHHGVELGNLYSNKTSGKEMIHYVAKSKRQELMKKFGDVSFFSLLNRQGEY